MTMHCRHRPADLRWRSVLRRTEAAYAAVDHVVRPAPPAVLSAAG
jgi:hypothetical protein